MFLKKHEMDCGSCDLQWARFEDYVELGEVQVQVQYPRQADEQADLLHLYFSGN